MANVAAGTRFGFYEVIDVIGAGGMGTVYRARDTRLPREAAIKLSGERFSDRFAREADAIASLNHPNITTLYDVGPDYLVMEMVEGPTLADRIHEGPLSLDVAADIGRQIAEALDYAHDRGIVHRDLKPGNVKIRPDGVVKVLDFGLAKWSAVEGSPQSEQRATMTADQTAAGVIVGTFAYMAPEQLTGKAADKRADIWAFGCVFYEMLTGESLHSGGSSQEIMASVLRDEPDFTAVPAPARRLLKRCLEKDPQKRLRHIGDVMALLDEAPSGQAPAGSTAVPAATSSRNSKWLWPAVGAAAVVIAGAPIFFWAPWRTTRDAGQAVRFEVPETDTLKFFYGAAMSVSPDGHWMVFPAMGEDGVARYWLRSLDTVEARALPGTEGAYVPAAWTADSGSVIFSTLGTPAISKVDIQGGPARTISMATGALNGASANRDGTVIFGTSAQGMPIFRVSASGGAPVALTAVGRSDTSHRFPQFLPDGRHFLYFLNSLDSNRAGVYVGALDGRPEAQSQTRIVATNREGYFTASATGGLGHLLFMRDSTLMAQPFDPDRLELSGEAVPVAEGVDSFLPQSYGMFSVSAVDSGALVYRGGAGAKLAPSWFDQSGRQLEAFDVGDSVNPAVSPDGTRIAVAAGPNGSRDIWSIDVVRKTATQLTFDPADDDFPIWSPDGKSIAFSSRRTGASKPYAKAADGSGDERLLTEQNGVPTSWSRDGRFLLFTSEAPTTKSDIWVLPDPGQPSRASKPYALVATPFVEAFAQFSPDGHWIAYQSSESSFFSDVFVRPFSPGTPLTGGAKWLVSKGGKGGIAAYPQWSSNGRQVFYLKWSDFSANVVDVDTSNGLVAATPRRLFSAPPPMAGYGWAVSPDDQRFVFITTPNGGRTAPFTVVLNWAAALKK